VVGFSSRPGHGRVWLPCHNPRAHATLGCGGGGGGNQPVEIEIGGNMLRVTAPTPNRSAPFTLGSTLSGVTFCEPTRRQGEELGVCFSKLVSNQMSVDAQSACLVSHHW